MSGIFLRNNGVLKRETIRRILYEPVAEQVGMTRGTEKDSEQVGMMAEVMGLKTKIGISRSVSAILTNL